MSYYWALREHKRTARMHRKAAEACYALSRTYAVEGNEGMAEWCHTQAAWHDNEARNITNYIQEQF